ncbi:MAG TPA: hypothetical protein PLE74_04760 [Candidatus Cloacimonadota bacterium]|nr:hypothetical protein [Candidatus Cloacimonadota bacterium]
MNRIRENFPKDHPSYSYLALPSNITFTSDGSNAVKMSLPSDAVETNMQEDKASFEGWALVMKRWGGFEKVVLRWESLPIDTGTVECGHYRRFLFRVANFSHDFSSWFSISPDNASDLKSPVIDEKKNYYLNRPSGNRGKGGEPAGKESKLESKYVCGGWSEYLKELVNAEFLDRQLPVGVFFDPEDHSKRKVSAENAIFSRGKSAIDLWGISKSNELLIFELKADGNTKVGIISELYFYGCVMQRIQKGQFKYEKHNNSPVDRIAGTRKIHAYFLSPELHPLIDKDLVGLLTMGTAPNVQFHYLRIPTGGGVPITLGFQPCSMNP